MAVTALQLTLAPLLLGASALAAHAFGQRVGGLVSAFPAIVGPFLLVSAGEHGARFASGVASGILAGLVSLAGFSLVYARTAERAAWGASLAAGSATAGALSLAVTTWRPGATASLFAGGGSLLLARICLPASESRHTSAASSRRDALGAMALGALLVVALAALARGVGAATAGVLAGVPVLASVLAVTSHRQHGSAPTLVLLRGMLDGMLGFVLFCEVVALMIVPAGTPLAFATATAGAVLAQGLALGIGGLRAGRPPLALRWG